MSFFRALHVHRDAERRTAALNMAIDEALFETATVPTLRLYGWRRPSLSFGYFGRFAEVEANGRDVVRRWTGGGIVLHGSDQTYSVILPRVDGQTLPRSQVIYAAIHAAIRAALQPFMQIDVAQTDAPRISAACFANPVASDLLVGGRKIAGAAQRRTRAGLLHQGSIQLADLPANFPEAFAAALCPQPEVRTFSPPLLARAAELAGQKYATENWLRQR